VGGIVVAEDVSRLELVASDPGQLRGLKEWLAATGQLTVERIPGRPGPGEQGIADLLMVLASSSSVVAAVKTLPDFIRSRRSGFHLEATVRGEKFVLDVSNANEGIQQVIDKLLSS
jgi:hypothetical protein